MTLKKQFSVGNLYPAANADLPDKCAWKWHEIPGNRKFIWSDSIIETPRIPPNFDDADSRSKSPPSETWRSRRTRRPGQTCLRTREYALKGYPSEHELSSIHAIFVSRCAHITRLNTQSYLQFICHLSVLQIINATDEHAWATITG